MKKSSFVFKFLINYIYRFLLLGCLYYSIIRIIAHYNAELMFLFNNDDSYKTLILEILASSNFIALALTMSLAFKGGLYGDE
jgi:hypothetical protein